jgi:hypothetical protein
MVLINCLTFVFFQIDMHLRRNVVLALQSVAEMHLVNIFLYVRLCRDHTKCSTLSPNDIRLVT